MCLNVLSFLTTATLKNYQYCIQISLWYIPYINFIDQNHKEAEFKERLDLLNSSPLLRTLPPDVKQKLAKAIEWHTYPPGTGEECFTDKIY